MADKKMYKVGITVKEPWSADISYEVLDVTLYAVESGGDGCSYTAIKPNQGVTPGTDSTVWVKSTQAGQSIYDLAVKYHHFVGTEEEFEQQYQDALAAANNAASAASATDEQIQANELARVSAENSRVTAERARSDAETARSSAETARINAENARNNAESLRDTAESDRVRAESGRVTAEASRVEAETFRQGAEQSRRQQFEALKTDMETAIDNVDAKAAEIEEDIEGYEANEAARVSAEQSRVTAESSRVSAESARATAETARETQAASDHTRAETDHGTAASDHTTAQADHTQAASDHNTAASDHDYATDVTQSAISATADADMAADAANLAAQAATEAAGTIDAKIATKADESEVSQLRSKVGGAYTDNARVNSVIRSLYIDLSGYTGQESLHDLYFTGFGYYQPTDSYYFQLKNYTGTFLTGGSFPRQSFNGHIYVEGNGVKVSMDADLSEFYNNTPHQMTIEKINPIAYVKQIVDEGAIANNSVTTNKIADAAVTMNKLAKGGELNEVIDFESRINKSILVDRMPDAIKTPDYFLGTNGAQVGPYPGAWAYYTLDVSPGEKYEVSSFAGQNARLWLLLNNNSVVSLSSDSSAASQKTDTIEIPIGVNKLVVNSAQYSGYTSINEIFIYVDAERVYVNQNLNIKQYVDQQVSNPANILAGKVLVCCGDSITEGVDMDAEGIVPTSTIDVYQSNGAGVFSQVITNFKKTYGYQIAERNGMTFYNAGVSGSTMQGLANKNGFSLADGRYTKLPDNIDYLTIWFGWNDTAYGTLGTINDATNESYYGGYNVVVPYLQNKYPYAKICLIVPFGTDEGHRNAIRQLANRWGLACFDMYQGGTPLYYGKEPSVGVLTSVVSANQVKFQANGAHPNFKGHRQIGDMLEHFLRGI